jgi:IS30 family transposase
MGRNYVHLDRAERLAIFHLVELGTPRREIARRLGRSASTISREVRRNGGRTRRWRGGYCPDRAQWLAGWRRRRDKRFKLARQPELQRLVRDRLAMGWSPAQIAGRLTLAPDGPQISHESIYRYIWHRRELKDWLCRLLPSGRTRRRPWRRRRGRAIPGRRPLSERPEAVAARREIGHWEVDVMCFRAPGGGLLVACERLSRRLLARRLPGLGAEGAAAALEAMLAPLPPVARRSLTFDNGPEFSRHRDVARALRADTWFCPPYAPWAKGGVENAIGRLRRALPRKTAIHDCDTPRLDAVIAAYNSTPRACLGYKSPTRNELSDFRGL